MVDAEPESIGVITDARTKAILDISVAHISPYGVIGIRLSCVIKVSAQNNITFGMA